MQPGAGVWIAASHCIGCNAVRTRNRRRLRLHSAARRRLLELLSRRSVCLLRGGEIARLQRGAELVAQFLVRLLSEQVGHTVVDKTGLAGSYEFTLQWKPDDSEGQADDDFRWRVGNCGHSFGAIDFHGDSRAAWIGTGATRSPHGSSGYRSCRETGGKLKGVRQIFSCGVIETVERPKRWRPGGSRTE
jgi:uncharacterized protein (TIGR03435 family)